MLTKVDQIRLAIALCALRFKLSSQSIPAYVCDLRNAFPAPNATVSPDHPWKCYLSELERKISELEAELDAEKISK